MSEEEKLPTHVGPSEESGEEEGSWREVAERWRNVGQQVRELGERLAVAFREGWETEEMAERETSGLAEQLRTLGERVDRAVDSVREQARTPETKEQARETVQATRAASTEFLEELQETLNDGLEDLNRRMDDIAKRRRGGTQKESSDQ